MKQCEYCGKNISYHDQYCSDECQIAANQYYSKTEKFAKPFMVVNTVCVFGIPVGIFLMSVQRMIGASVAATSCVVLGIRRRALRGSSVSAPSRSASRSPDWRFSFADFA